MLSQSPPIFSHSPPVSFLSDFMSSNHQGIGYNDENNKTPRYSLPQVITLASKARVNNASSFGQTRSNGPNTRYGKTYLERMVSAPDLSMQPKSCLIRKSCLCKSKTSSSVTVKDAHDTEKSSTRIQKKVIFADDEGLSLTEVRVMSEPSNVPPYWSIQFLEQITQGLVSPHPADQWTVDFKQPASDYLSFRHKIDTNFVSLENVIVKDEESIVVGTVKVKNISFKKEIIVRVTWDNWKSQQDIFCTFARAYGPTTCSHVVFDTFSFKITLPPSSKLLEFCICFRAEDQEYWDNNNGKNYTISKRSPLYYNALSPYDKSPPRYNCLSPATSSSSLSDTFEPTIEDQLDNTPSPYW